MNDLINSLEDRHRHRQDRDDRNYESLITALKDLNDVIGLDDVKEKVCRQVKYALYNLEKKTPISGMHHTLITGDPDLGKSMLATKLGNIWLSLGILEHKKEPVATTEVNVKELTNFLMWLHRLSQEPCSRGVSRKGRVYTISKTQMEQSNRKHRRHLRASVCAYIDKLYQGKMAELYRTQAWRTIKDIYDNKFEPERETGIYNEFVDPFFLTFNGRLSGIIPPVGTLTDVTTKPICKIFRKSDLVGKYVGQTAPKTEKALKSCLGGVFILDEAYSLLNNKSCKFGIESLNCINQFMSEHPNEIIIIFCGYKDMIENLYKAQRGLARRFNWVYDLTKYTSEELVKIYKSKLLASDNFMFDESVDDSKLLTLFDRKKDLFQFQAGDVENLATLTQIEVATTNWNAPRVNDYISLKNIKDALDRFEKGKGRKNGCDTEPPMMMYL